MALLAGSVGNLHLIQNWLKLPAPVLSVSALRPARILAGLADKLNAVHAAFFSDNTCGVLVTTALKTTICFLNCC